MKKLFTALLLLVGFVSFSQTTGYFRYDSIRFEKVGGNAEFILLNGTRNVTGGVLTNLGNGRTAFVTPGGGGGTGGLSGGNLGSGFRIYYPPSEGTKTLFNGYALNIDSSSNSNGLTFKIDSFNIATRAFRDKLKDSLGAVKQATLLSGTNIKTINGSSLLGSGDLTVGNTNTSIGSAFRVAVNGTNNVKSLKAGTNVSLDSSVTGEIAINASGDNNWVYLSDYGTPNDGLQDTTALQTAVATGKNVYITPGIWEYTGKGNGVVLAKGQIIRGYGLSSIIHFTADTINVFNMSNDSSFIDQVSFVGKGRGSIPGGEVFTFSNAVKIGGHYNKVRNCYFSKVKGAGVTLWALATIYGNDVSSNNFDSCGVGIYALTNAEYGQFSGNKMQYCRAGFIERCAGNNNWLNITSLYNDYGARILGSSGCNGDHGQVTASIFNHNGVAMDIQQINNEYSFVNVKFYFGDVNFGSTDTVRRVIMDNCVFSGNTINVTKASQCQVTGGTFGTSAVTVNAGSGVKFCNIQNSAYSTVACISGSGTLQDVTDAGSTSNHTISITSGSDLTFDNGSSNTTTLNALTSSGAIILNLPPGNTGDTLATKAYARSVGGGGGSTYTFSNGLTESGGTVTNNLSVGVTGGQTIKGGTGTTDKLTIQSTTGNGTGTAVAFDFKSANNGGTQSAQALNNGSWAFGSTAIDGYFFTKLPNGNGGWLHRDQFGNNIMNTTPAGISTFQAINSTTNTSVKIMSWDFQTSGTAANGLGLVQAYDIENGSGTVRQVAEVGPIYTDVTNASEDADFVFKNIVAGTLKETARFGGATNLTLSYDGSNNATFSVASNGLLTISGAGSGTAVQISSVLGIGTTPDPSYYLKAGTSNFTSTVKFDGGIITKSTTSSAGSLSLTVGTSLYWIFNGTTSTWTLPTLTGTTDYNIFIKNIGSGNITLNSNAGGNDIYDASAVNTLTITPGSGIHLHSNGTYWIKVI